MSPDLSPSAPADNVIEQETTILTVPQYDVLPGTVAGIDVVILLVQVNDGEDDVVLTLALPSEDAHRIARSLISVASTVRPLQVQERIAGLTAGKEGSSK